MTLEKLLISALKYQVLTSKEAVQIASIVEGSKEETITMPKELEDAMARLSLFEQESPSRRRH